MIDLSSHGKIHLLLGCDLSQTFCYPIRYESLGLPYHPAQNPNLNLSATPFNSKLVLSGHAGVNPDLVSDQYPSFNVAISLCLPNKETSTAPATPWQVPIDNLVYHDPQETAENIHSLCSRVSLTKTDAEELSRYIESEGKPELFLSSKCLRHSRSQGVTPKT